MHSFYGLQVRLKKRIQLVNQLSKIDSLTWIFSHHFLNQVSKWLGVFLFHTYKSFGKLSFVHLNISLIWTVLKDFLLLIQKTHRQSQEAHAKYISLLLVYLGLWRSVFEIWDILWAEVGQYLVVCAIILSLPTSNKLQGQLIVALSYEYLAINKYKAAILIHQYLLRPQS